MINAAVCGISELLFCNPFQTISCIAGGTCRTTHSIKVRRDGWLRGWELLFEAFT
jgi:hypothetical protein